MLLDAFALLPLRCPAPPAPKLKSERRKRQRERQLARLAASSSSHAAGTGDRHVDTQEEREDEAAPVEEERLATQSGGASSPKRAKSSKPCRHADTEKEAAEKAENAAQVVLENARKSVEEAENSETQREKDKAAAFLRQWLQDIEARVKVKQEAAEIAARKEEEEKAEEARRAEAERVAAERKAAKALLQARQAEEAAQKKLQEVVDLTVDREPTAAHVHVETLCRLCWEPSYLQRPCKVYEV